MSSCAMCDIMMVWIKWEYDWMIMHEIMAKRLC